jgi:carbon-monoxide dehydrogenase small subunit
LEFSPPSDGSTVKDSSKAARRESIHAISSEKIQIDLTVNGEHHSLLVSPNDLLINTLREQLNLTGAKYGCGIGECGACTIEIDGEPALACLVLSVSARDREILTAEGINEPDGKLHPLQEAFIEHAAYQCGYCTPGFVMTAKGLLAENPTPNEEEVRSYLKGNLCRCTGYASIVRAIMSSTDEAQGGND